MDPTVPAPNPGLAPGPDQAPILTTALASTTAIPGPAPGPTGADLAAGLTAESADTEAPVIHPCPIAAGMLAIGPTQIPMRVWECLA